MPDDTVRGALGDINQKERPERPVEKDDIIENPEEFDGLKYFELTKDSEDKQVEEAKLVEKKSKTTKLEDNIVKDKVEFEIGGAFKNRLPYKDNIPDEWIVSREKFKELYGNYVYEATFFIYAKFSLVWYGENLTFQLDMLRKGLYLLEKAWDWETDENCIEGHISNSID